MNIHPGVRSAMAALTLAFAGCCTRQVDPVCSALLSAVDARDEAAVIRALDAGAEPDCRGPGERPMLVIAVTRRLDHVVQTLLERGASVDARGVDGRTALILAASQGDVGVVELLLAHRASRDITDSTGWTARQYAEEGAKVSPGRADEYRRVLAALDG